jgi:hypothetical protein
VAWHRRGLNLRFHPFGRVAQLGPKDRWLCRVSGEYASQASVNDISIVTLTATGIPSFMPGLNSHCFAADTA